MSSLPPDDDTPFHRFSALVMRELGAVDVRILESAEEPTASNALAVTLLDGRQVLASFVAAPKDAPSTARRMEILVRTFEQSLTELPLDSRAGGRPIQRSLRDELRALAMRAHAADALVLDAHSPVVWGSALQAGSLPESVRLVEVARPELVPSAVDQDVPFPEPVASASVLRDPDEVPASSQRAIHEVRALPEISALRRGKPLHHTQRGEDFGYVAHAFAGIYLLLVVFESAFDELRAEKAIADVLPRIERLVVALPPHDPAPSPTSNVVAFRRPQRR